MPLPMKRLIGLVVATAALVLGIAATAWGVTPNNGIYQGIINGSENVGGHNEGEGLFRVRKTSAGKQIVPANCCGYSAARIVAPNNIFGGPPSYPHCDPYNAALAKTSLAISNGAFDYKGNAVNAASSTRYPIHFKGAWVSRTKVKGFTRITKGSCDTGKMPWTMRTPPP